MAEVYTVAAVHAVFKRYGLGEIGYDEFVDWLTPLVWDEEGEAEAVSLGWRAALGVAEASSGHRSEADLRAELLALVPAEAAPQPSR